ncbi:DUF1876 domain-containing protein [Catenuloplanes atrovinosus]|uniref:DUF1876 domain-containing protein n=1 Tax=Catenuloplanes atrovinosus TaxID=137266 RepID=A0AAE4CAD5_9ACTN|nr:DUF1876 domain-containing protein [Catenuloplanes atrovinosus]MDR7276943.1 hypothetical protein [Catenuloplanes atrovinosus]
MSATKRWNVEILIGETHRRTYAEAQLYDEISNELIGHGSAAVHPDEPVVPEVGDEIAVARALADLGNRLLVTAAGDLEDVLGTRVQLER